MTYTAEYTSEHEQQFNVEIHGKSIEITDAIRSYVLEKVHKCERLVNMMINLNVRLEVNKLQHTCDLLIHFSHFRIKASASVDDLYAAIDKAFDRLYSMVRKWKTRIQDHHAKGLSATEVEIQILEQLQEQELADEEEIVDANNDNLPVDFEMPKVARKKTRPLKILTVDEALMKIDLSGDNFLLFRSEEDQGLKVIYRRRDGSYGIMAPSNA